MLLDISAGAPFAVEMNLFSNARLAEVQSGGHPTDQRRSVWTRSHERDGEDGDVDVEKRPWPGTGCRDGDRLTDGRCGVVDGDGRGLGIGSRRHGQYAEEHGGDPGETLHSPQRHARVNRP